MTFDTVHTLAQSEEIVGAFGELIAQVPYERKGVLFSEMLFVRATVGTHVPKQVLESGRARGQSTHVLALSFPRSRVVSVEYRADSPDVQVAEERLRHLPNVCLLYGDARKLHVQLLQAGDVVLIDGPKGYRALSMAFNLLQTGKPVLVFVHDCHRGSPARRFLERHVPSAFFSDDPEFVERYGYMDGPCAEAPGDDQTGGWGPYEFQGTKQDSYGPTVACIPWEPDRSYRALGWRARAWALARKWRKSGVRMARSIRSG